MKKIIFTSGIVLYTLFICNCVVWGGNWYVDPVNGLDTNAGYYDYVPFRHIWKAIEQASSSDNIYLKSGDYSNEGIRKGVTIYNSTWTPNAYIHVTKQLTFDNYNSSTPRIVGYCSSSSPDSLSNLYMMIIDASYVTVQDIKFDGFNFYYSGFYPFFDWWLPHHGTLEISGNGSNATIQNCEFKHMGRSLNLTDPVTDKWAHESIIGSHPMGVSGGSPINYVQILYNVFQDNLFDTSHGHEIYLTTNSNADIKYNVIYNHGVGVPVRFSNGCSDVLVEGNTIYGAAERGYVHDWNDTTWTVSSDIQLISNTFATSGDHGSYMNNNYTWPFRSSGELNKYSGYISEFTGNTVYSDYSDNNYVQAVAIGDDSLYVSQYDSSVEQQFLSSRVHRFPNPQGPIFKPCVGESIDGSLCRGDMCVVSNYIVTASVISGGINKLGCYLPGTSTDATSILPSLGSTDKVTALCSSGFTGRFITGITVNGTAKLYIGTADLSTGHWNDVLLWESASVDSITAIARYGSTLVFAGYDNSTQTTTFYYGTLVISPYSLEYLGSSSSDSTYVPAMTYKSNTLITATVSTNVSPQTTRLYEGTAASPFNSPVYGPSTTTKFLSLAGTSLYLYSVVSNTNDNSDKKVFITDTTSNPFKDVLFFSYWGPYDIN